MLQYCVMGRIYIRPPLCETHRADALSLYLRRLGSSSLPAGHFQGLEHERTARPSRHHRSGGRRRLLLRRDAGRTRRRPARQGHAGRDVQGLVWGSCAASIQGAWPAPRSRGPSRHRQRTLLRRRWPAVQGAMIVRGSTVMATTMRVVAPRGFARSRREDRNADPVRGASGYWGSAARRTRARSCPQRSPRGRSFGRRGLGMVLVSMKSRRGRASYCVVWQSSPSSSSRRQRRAP